MKSDTLDEPRLAVVRSTARTEAATRDFMRAVKAHPVRLTRRMTVEEAFRVTVLECLAQVSANTPPVVHARNVEGLHQMRVGLRRLHVALFAFGDEFRTPALGELRTRTKAFTDAIAPARDLDVFIGELLDAPERAGPSAESFRILRERAEAARRVAWEEAVAHISSPDFSSFLDDVAVAAETHSWYRHAVNAAAHRAKFRADEPIRPTAINVLDGHLARVRRRGRKMKSLDEHHRHRLRIALKKLRYASEFFGPLFHAKGVKKYLRHVKTLLDDLGALNDVATVRIILGRLLQEEGGRRANPDLAFAGGLVNGWHNARADSLGRDAVARWEAFRRLDPFWR